MDAITLLKMLGVGLFFALGIVLYIKGIEIAVDRFFDDENKKKGKK